MTLLLAPRDAAVKGMQFRKKGQHTKLLQSVASKLLIRICHALHLAAAVFLKLEEALRDDGHEEKKPKKRD